MKKIIIVISLIFSSILFSQPVGNNDINYEINLSFKNIYSAQPKDDGTYILKTDTISLIKTDSIYFSTDNKLKIKILTKNYDFSRIRKVMCHNLKNKNSIKINYTPAFIMSSCSDLEFSEPLSDVILLIEKQDEYMKIIFKLYSGKNKFYDNKVNISIPFCAGTYEVTGFINPILIAIKER